MKFLLPFAEGDTALADDTYGKIKKFVELAMHKRGHDYIALIAHDSPADKPAGANRRAVFTRP